MKMKRKRFVKLLMACGLPRNLANRTAQAVREREGSYLAVFLTVLDTALDMKEATATEA